MNPLHYPKIVKLRVEKRLTKRFGGLFALSFKLPSDCSSSFQGEVFLLRMWIVAITTAKVIAPITVLIIVPSIPHAKAVTSIAVTHATPASAIIVLSFKVYPLPYPTELS